MQNILEHYSITNKAYLHPKGEDATNELLEKLDCKENETTLEIEFGTVATLVYFSSIFEKTNFFGIEYNISMYKKGEARIKFCKNKNIRLSLNKN